MIVSLSAYKYLKTIGTDVVDAIKQLLLNDAALVTFGLPALQYVQ